MSRFKDLEKEVADLKKQIEELRAQVLTLALRPLAGFAPLTIPEVPSTWPNTIPAIPQKWPPYTPYIGDPLPSQGTITISCETQKFQNTQGSKQ